MRKLLAFYDVYPVDNKRTLLSLGEVVAKMDEDSDGVIRVEHVNKVKTYICFITVLRIRIGIRIRKSRMFLGFLDPVPDPFVKRYGSGSGSGSFIHQAKIVRRLIPTVL